MGEEVDGFWVACYSGSAYAERPQFVGWEGERLAVTAVIKRWRMPQGKGFVVRLEDDRLLELVYDEAGLSWSLVRFL